MSTLKKHDHSQKRRQPLFIADEIFDFPTLPSHLMFEIATVNVEILMKQDEKDTSSEFSKDESEDRTVSTFYSAIKEDNLDY